MINLQNKIVLVTREELDADRFAVEIINHGGHAITMPLLEINCLSVEKPIQLISANPEYDWVFFTSKNGVNCFLKDHENQMFLQESTVKIAAVGSKTAEALTALGYHVDFIPSLYNAEVMASEFLKKYKNTGRTLFVRGVLASNILLDAFTKAKRQFDCYEVYNTITNTQIKDKLHRALHDQTIDILTFTSPSTINAFLEVVENPELFFGIPTVCIGTTTEKRAIAVGFTETIVPEVFTTHGMVVSLSDYLKSERSSK